ncbi:M-phase-specific PLK1-interacting protein [Cheilinus undulatus]|uniref:M-phase-specific PLK1-interacting protein n=1 Tax=Cheilinus undulatus TaxID=241271 RepID=UPI001BD1C855|nr:M-phase-specific PLK1-interacting protein [Cheilinus undulatus]
MYRAPVRPQRSPGAPRPPGRFPSPGSGWGFPGGSATRGGSPLRSPGYSPRYSPGFSPGSPRGFGAFRRPPSFSPSAHLQQSRSSSDAPVEKYFSPAMMQDPWAALQPVPQPVPIGDTQTT